MSLLPFSGPPTLDATALVKGKVQLTNDLGGTAASPKVKRTTRFIVAPFGYTGPADYLCANNTANDVEIQAAMAAANALPNGGVVDVLDGTFTFSNWLTPLNNVTLQGRGMFQTKFTSVANGSKELVSFPRTRDDPLTNFIMTDIELDGSNFNPSFTLKALHGLCYNNCRFERLYIHDSTATGFGADFPSNSIVSNNYVVHCGFQNEHTIIAASWSANVFTYQTADANNYVGGAQASGTLTAIGIISDGDIVSLDTLVYTFKTTLTGAAFEVAIAGSTANALSNLNKAIKLTGVAGTDYGTGTVKHPSVTTGTLTSTTLQIVALVYAASGNIISTVATGANISFGASTLSGGVTGSKIVIAGMSPGDYGGMLSVTSVVDSTTFTVSATNNSDGLFHFSDDPGPATGFGSTSDSLIGHNGIGIGINENYNESVICTGNVSIGNQNYNYLIEDDGLHPTLSPSYVLSENISIGAGNVGYKITGAKNCRINNNSDYNSRVGCQINTSASATGLLSASWSAGTATFTTKPRSVPFEPGTTTVLISGMIPSTWNGYFVVQTEPDSATFTVAMTSDPGGINYLGKETALLRTTVGSAVKDNVFAYNHDYGIQAGNQADGLMIMGNVIEYSGGPGLQSNTSYSQIRNNKIHHNALTGLQLTTSTAQPLVCTDITGNQVYNNGLVSTSAGILLTVAANQPCSDIKIEGNHSFDNQTVMTQSVSLKITGSPTNVSVAHNNLANSVANIQLPSTDGVYAHNNIGVNPQGKSDLGNITGAVTFDSSLANYFTATLTGNITPTMPASLVDGRTITMVLTQDATGSRTWTAPSNTVTSGTLTLSITPSVTDTVVWAYNLVLAKWVEVSRSINDTQYPSVVTKTSNFTMTVANDIVLADCTSANVTIKLPTAIGVAGKKFTVKRINAAGSFSVFFAVATSSGQTIDGTATQIVLTDQWQSSTVVSDGSNWYQTSTVDNPMTTLGDTIYENASLVPARLAGNITSTKKYLSQTGTGSVSAVPAWAQVAAADLSNGVTGSGSVVLATSPTLVTPVLGTPSSGVATNLTGTAAGLTAGAATILATTRAIYGNNFDGSAALTQIIASTYGGTGNGFAKLNGPASSEKTFTLPNASATVLTDNAAVTVAQGGTGAATLTGILKGNGTSAFTAVTAPSGALVGDTDTQTLTNKRITPRVVSMSDATSFTPTGDTADINTQVNTQAAGTLTANSPSGTPTDGQKIMLRIKCTNAQTYAWNAIYRGSNDVALPTSTTGSSKTDRLLFVYNSADTTWDLLAKNLGF